VSSQEGATLSSNLPQHKSAFPLLDTSATADIDHSLGIDTHSKIDFCKFQQSNCMSSSRQLQDIHRLYNFPNTGGSAIDDIIDPPANTASLNDVWSAIRQKKERRMAKEKPKVQSLEVVPEQLASGTHVQEEGPSVRIPVMESHVSPTRAAAKKQKSMCVSFLRLKNVH